MCMYMHASVPTHQPGEGGDTYTPGFEIDDLHQTLSKPTEGADTAPSPFIPLVQTRPVGSFSPLALLTFYFPGIFETMF